MANLIKIFYGWLRTEGDLLMVTNYGDKKIEFLPVFAQLIMQMWKSKSYCLNPDKSFQPIYPTRLS